MRSLLLLSGLFAASASLPAQAPPVACGPETVLTPLGFDSRAARVWFALNQPMTSIASSRWLVEWQPGRAQAHLHEEVDPGSRFAPSAGPGRLFALQPCGDSCIQPIEFDGRAWAPLGSTLSRPPQATAHTTYDGSGVPWIVLHTQSEADGFFEAWAFRLEDDTWRDRGRISVTAVGHPGAGPTPWQEDSVVSGTGQFSAGSEPRAWLAGVPAADGRGQVVAISRRSAAFVTADSRIFRTVDGGSSWSRSTWTPWRRGTAEPWQRGVDWDVDLPSGFDSGSLQLAWFDRRRTDRSTVTLSEMSPEGRWREIASLPDSVRTEGGDNLPLSHILGPATGPWSLLYGCVQSAGKPAIVVRTPGRDEGHATLIPIIDPTAGDP